MHETLNSWIKLFSIITDHHYLILSAEKRIHFIWELVFLAGGNAFLNVIQSLMILRS